MREGACGLLAPSLTVGPPFPERYTHTENVLRHGSTEGQWELIRWLWPGQPGDPGRTAAENRLFVDAVLLVLKMGLPWADLPARFGKPNMVWKRYDRWYRAGGWERVARALGADDLGEVPFDSTTIKEYPVASTGRRLPAEKMRPRTTAGGIGGVIAAAADNDAIQRRGAKAVIPTWGNRLDHREIDPAWYRERNVMGQLRARAKQFRRVATRYEKKAANFLGFVWVASLIAMLK